MYVKFWLQMDCVLSFNINIKHIFFFRVAQISSKSLSYYVPRERNISSTIKSSNHQSDKILSKINQILTHSIHFYVLAHWCIKPAKWMCAWKIEWLTQHGNKCALYHVDHYYHYLLSILFIVLSLHTQTFFNTCNHEKHDVRIEKLEILTKKNNEKYTPLYRKRLYYGMS